MLRGGAIRGLGLGYEADCTKPSLCNLPISVIVSPFWYPKQMINYIKDKEFNIEKDFEQ